MLGWSYRYADCAHDVAGKGNIAAGRHPPLPRNRDQVAPLNFKIDTQVSHIPPPPIIPIIVYNSDLYVSRVFRISPR